MKFYFNSGRIMGELIVISEEQIRQIIANGEYGGGGCDEDE
jgi:hypothetical protein